MDEVVVPETSEPRPGKKPSTGPQSGSSRAPGEVWNAQAGFTMVEFLMGMVILAILGVIFSGFLSALIQGGGRETSRAMMIASGRNGMDAVANTLRMDFVQFVNDPNLLGVNFDLDDEKQEIVRDAILFYVDRNLTAQLYTDDESQQPVSAGFDDVDGDGQADVVGIGLVWQDSDGDGFQDFVDIDNDGRPDDLDGDNQGDLLWRFVIAEFPNLAAVQDRDLWEGGRTVSENVFIRTPQGARRTAPNIDTIQFYSRDVAAIASDKNGDKLLDETELGSLRSGGGVIDHVVELGAIDGVIVNLHLAAVRSNQRDRLRITNEVSSQIAPRSIALFRRNGIIGLADATDPDNVN